MSASKLGRRLLLSLAMASSAVLGFGCDDATNDDPLAELPEVRSAVGLDELCDLATEIHCAGAVGCCEAESPYGSVDECMAAASCEDRLAAIRGSFLFADGIVSYDASAATTLLADLADATSHCGTESPALAFEAVFVGTLSEGEDCSPRDGSGAHLLACAPGLACVLYGDDGPGASLYTCERAEVYTAEPAEPEPTVEARYCAAS